MALALFCFAAFLARPAAAAEAMSFIRDAEIENTIRTFATPVFRAAGLDSTAVKLYLVKDKTLNAFVAGGQNLFINTGLLIRTEHAGQLIGVIAHETGHIAGGHLLRIGSTLENASTQSILGVVIGAAAAIATGKPELATAIASGSQQLAMNNLLRFSQTQEYSADLAALKFLESTHMSAKGLSEFLGILGDQEALYTSAQDPYVRTHPLTRDRIETLQAQISKSRYYNAKLSPEFEEMHRRMQAKLVGFIEPMTTVLKRYPENDNSLESRYARAIAYYKRPDLEKALPLIESLIAERPEDPYFQELKGQVLFENGRPAEAMPAYEMAVRMLPNEATLRVGLAQIQIELNAANHDPALLDQAVLHLRAGLAIEPKVPFMWKLLAIAHGRKNEMGMSSLAMAEEAILQGRRSDARFLADRANRTLPEGSPYRLQAQDLMRATEDRKERR